MKLAIVRALPNIAATSHRTLSLPPSPTEAMTPWYIIHFDTKPLKGGMPDIDNDATRNAANVRGIYLARPPSFERSVVPDLCSTLPAEKNRQDLYKAGKPYIENE